MTVEELMRLHEQALLVFAETCSLQLLGQDWNAACEKSKAAEHALRSALEQVVRGWSPIASAPRDGTVVDLWVLGNQYHSPMRVPDCWFGAPDKWSAACWMYISSESNHEEPLPWEPSHWMLPPGQPRSIFFNKHGIEDGATNANT